MNKELLDKKLSVLLDQDVQKEMELRARMGLKLRPELKFYGICSSSKTEPKNSENLPHYLFVTTDEKKANKAEKSSLMHFKAAINRRKSIRNLTFFLKSKRANFCCSRQRRQKVLKLLKMNFKKPTTS